MNNYYKYLPISDEDARWGLSVVNAGCTRVKPDSCYPVPDHPGHHNFNWKKGRVLNEYQIIYITAGKGVFESDSAGIVDIQAGTIIILYPGDRHRYKPNTYTGWDEYWIGVKGEVIERLVSNGFFKPELPCLYIGFNDKIFNTLNYIIDQTKTESPGYQPDISSAALALLGSCHAIVRQGAVNFDSRNPVIHKALLLFRSNVNEDFSPEIAAEQLQVGYSWFRKVFKAHTGLSPGQYFIQLKIERAKNLLGDTSLSTKWIANDLRFESYFYFCRLFKSRTGMTPLEYRKRVDQGSKFKSDA